MRRRRKFVNGEVNHTYQRTVSGFNIFYEVEDYLVYYTIFSVLAIKYGIMVYGLCLMIDHIHSLISAADRKSFCSFIRHVSLLFVKEYNKEHGRSGPLFQEGFGSAPKIGLKRLRTAIAYLFNNPVERFLCSKAQEYRWNFLPYAQCKNPYSEPIRLRLASRALRRAIKEVDETRERDQHITYTMIRRLFSTLDKKEKNQLTDYIIVRYSVIRYDLLTACYGGLGNMILAINSNTGSEYDINETICGRSDTEFRELHRYVHAEGFENAGDVISLDGNRKLHLMEKMQKHTSASVYQIRKFLHLEVCGS
jgi:REP element-mobilizing transposase RayT